MTSNNKSSLCLLKKGYIVDFNVLKLSRFVCLYYTPCLYRALLYTIVEDMLTNFGMDGKACLLRTICEVHGHKAIHRFGFIGEFLQLFLS